MIISHGTTRRPVIVIGRWALKFARNELGRRCNQYEADLYRSSSEQRRKLLCPVIWLSDDGELLIMAAATPLAEALTLDEYLALGTEWNARLGEDDCPFEPKAADWGWHDGRRVALDYSTPVL
jgi:hypothetical protein